MRRSITLLLLLAAACGGDTSPPAMSPPPDAGLQVPYAYVTPTPPAEPTSIDGVYARALSEDRAGGAGPCRRCPPYRLEVAESTLIFERGVFRIENQVAEEKAIDWRSVGHYTVDGDTVTLFNDPNCPHTRGAYRWALTADGLALEVVEDDCAFGGLRQRYLMAAPWAALS